MRAIHDFQQKWRIRSIPGSNLPIGADGDVSKQFQELCEGNQSRIVQVIEYREANITLVPSTVVPVTRLHSFKNILTNVLNKEATIRRWKHLPALEN